MACSLRHIRLALGKLSHATPSSSPHAHVLAKVDQALNEALSELGALAGIQHMALEQHRELYAILTSDDALHTGEGAPRLYCYDLWKGIVSL